MAEQEYKIYAVSQDFACSVIVRDWADNRHLV